MALTRDGGKPNLKDLEYCTPQGPTSQGHVGPGLGGENTRVNNNTVPATESSGSPGLGGTNGGNSGTQGRH